MWENTKSTVIGLSGGRHAQGRKEPSKQNQKTSITQPQLSNHCELHFIVRESTYVNTTAVCCSIPTNAVNDVQMDLTESHRTRLDLRGTMCIMHHTTACSMEHLHIPSSQLQKQPTAAAMPCLHNDMRCTTVMGSHTLLQPLPTLLPEGAQHNLCIRTDHYMVTHRACQSQHTTNKQCRAPSGFQCQ